MTSSMTSSHKLSNNVVMYDVIHDPNYDVIDDGINVVIDDVITDDV